MGHEIDLGKEVDVVINVVVLDGRRSYTKNKETGQKTGIEYEKGQYVMYVWVHATEKGTIEEQSKILKGNKFATVASEEPGFSRQVKKP
jgi:hypothetical protein